jgi:nucleoside 2-deoxyribosyltransferase
VYLPALRQVVTPVDPWARVSPEEFALAQKENRIRDLGRAVGRWNITAIAQCELVVAYLEGQELDSGTVAEVGYAAGLGITCYALRTDLRASGDLDAPVNLQVEAFIVESGGTIFSTLDAMVARLSDL